MIFEEEVLKEGKGLYSVDPLKFSGPATFLDDILMSGALLMQQFLSEKETLLGPQE